ncbi:DUF7336 domain-containing protein [Cohnella mopanensis]|uniref:DUF7336 domain-containing protein n=1 Tax=Cohnella mopanensis TaxID=2911966 RepID=UPI001EF7C61E|nr:hypothetical protein [Cohnella mopanensis]
MNHIYILEHSYEIGDFDETKLIGVYSSRDLAQKAIDKYIKLPGFNKYHLDCFHIEKYEINKDHWEEGFITWEEANKNDTNE